MNVEMAMKISLIIDKMGIDLSLLEADTKEQMGIKLLSVMVSKLHKAEKEIYEFIALRNNISEEEAKYIDIIKFLKEILSIEGMSDFLASPQD